MIISQQPYGDPGAWAFRSWRLRAACREVDSAVFFSPETERAPERDVREARAKSICARCPVIRECAVYALRHGERYGVWGGLSERDRVPFQLGA
jgi:WhiB family redox-sensing transcriptional regulator